MQDCYNTRMELHLGRANAEKYDMLIDFDKMKQEYDEYDNILPQNRIIKKYAQGSSEESIKEVVSLLKDKTKKANRFDF